MKGLTLSVSQLNEYVRKSLAGDPMLQHICVVGEISTFKAHVSGHWYFSLKDADAAVNCAMFRQAAAMVRFRPENGMKVRLFGSAGLYAKTGSYQLYADMMERDGMGEVYLRFEALKMKLMEEGLFDAALKKPLPLLPKGVGIVTSGTGAVLHDIMTVSKRRNPGMPLYLLPVSVQGEGAAREIVAGLRAMDGFEGVDVLIVGRGGGSMEDLQPFIEESVARAIAACRKPVVSAVGHETDFTIADFVADARAPTPSAAAEICVAEREALLDGLNAPLDRMENALHAALADRGLCLARLQADLRQWEPGQRVQKQEMALHTAWGRLDAAASLRLDREERRWEQAALRLRATGPEATLGRGYAVVLRQGKPLRSAGEAAAGEDLRVLLAEGALTATVRDIETEGSLWRP